MPNTVICCKLCTALEHSNITASSAVISDSSRLVILHTDHRFLPHLSFHFLSVSCTDVNIYEFITLLPFLFPYCDARSGKLGGRGGEGNVEIDSEGGYV